LVIWGHIGYDVIPVNERKKGLFIAGSAYYTGVGAAYFSNTCAIVTCLGKQDSELYAAAKALSCSMEGVKIIENEKSPEFNLYYSSSGP
jgi:hypothetical protein